MWRHSWLLAMAALACANQNADSSLVAQPTRVRVSPEAFLGDQPCSENGGMHRYQATLIDVTDGLDSGFRLQSSDVVACTTDVEFGFVDPERRYIAEVVGFDRSDISPQNPGSIVVVNEKGRRVDPRWTTTCFGYDGLSNSDEDALGGAGGAGVEFGVEAFENTVVIVRGCEPLRDSGGSDSRTGVSLSIESALLGLSCGKEAGSVATFTAQRADAVTTDESSGGAGGAAGDGSTPELESSKCSDALVTFDVPEGERVEFVVEGFEADGDKADGDKAIWATRCRALTRPGLVVEASCDAAAPL